MQTKKKHIYKGIQVHEFFKNGVHLYRIYTGSKSIIFALYTDCMEYIDRYLIEGLPQCIKVIPDFIERPIIPFIERPTSSKDCKPTASKEY